MTTEARVYIVKDRLNASTRLVHAQNPAQALRFVANNQFSVAAAKPKDLVGLLGTAIKVEYASDAAAADEAA